MWHYPCTHCAKSGKTSFSCKDNCTLTKHTRRWTYSALRYFCILSNKKNIPRTQDPTFMGYNTSLGPLVFTLQCLKMSHNIFKPKSGCKYHFSILHSLAPLTMLDHFWRACGVPAVGVRAVDCWQWRSGHYFHPSFLFFPCFFPPFFPVFFSSVATFSHRRSARIKKLILRKLLRTPKNLG